MKWSFSALLSNKPVWVRLSSIIESQEGPNRCHIQLRSKLMADSFLGDGPIRTHASPLKLCFLCRHAKGLPEAKMHANPRVYIGFIDLQVRRNPLPKKEVSHQF